MKFKAILSASAAAILLTTHASAMAALVASYPMTEASWSGAPPQVIDATGNGHSGTAVGGANTVANSTFGRVGSFNGSGQFVTVGGSQALSGARTIVAWVDPFANSVGLGQPILTGGVSGSGDFFGITGTGAGTLNTAQYHLYVDHWGTSAYISSSAVTPNQWDFIALTFDGASTVNFYINGQPAGSVTTGGLYNYDASSYVIAGNTIGGTTTAGSLDGLLHGVGVYNTQLTATQIGNLYTSVPEPSTAGLMLAAATATLSRRRRIKQ